MKFSKKWLLIVGLYLSISPLWAYDEPNLIVTATRSEQDQVLIPAGVTVISREELMNNGVTSIAEALRGRGGVQVIDHFGDGTDATVDMRGFGESAGSNILVLVDGRRLNNTDIEVPDLSSISLMDVERIEIIQGSAGSLYGDQAVGGVINIITRRPEKFGATVRLSSGSFGREHFGASISDRLNENFSYRLSAETLSADNFRDHNRLEYDNLFARINYDYVSGYLFLEFQNNNRDYEQPGALLEAEIKQDRKQSLIDFANDFNKTETQSMRLGLRQKLSDDWDFSGELTNRDSEDDFLLNFSGCVANSSCAIIPENEIRTQNSFAPSFLGTYATENGDIILTVGADLIDSEYESTFTNRSNEQKIDSFYVQAIVPVTRDFSYTIAARRAKVENQLVDQSTYPDGVVIDDDVSVASFGMNYKFLEQWRLFARADENFRFAKVDEQAYTEVGEVGLHNQSGKSLEMGMEWKSLSGHYIKMVAYNLKLDNEIAYDPTANGPGSFPGANVNLDSTRRDGVILEASYYIAPDFRLSATSTHIDAEFESGIYQGKKIPAVAERISTLSADYLFFNNWNVYLEMQSFGEQYLAGDNDNLFEKKPSYTVVNANFSYQVDAWRLSARINNLGDREYIESANTFGAYPSPERNVWVSAEYTFQ